jgi:hypothetical protein
VQRSYGDVVGGGGRDDFHSRLKGEFTGNTIFVSLRVVPQSPNKLPTYIGSILTVSYMNNGVTQKIVFHVCTYLPRP